MSLLYNELPGLDTLSVIADLMASTSYPNGVQAVASLAIGKWYLYFLNIEEQAFFDYAIHHILICSKIMQSVANCLPCKLFTIVKVKGLIN